MISSMVATNKESLIAGIKSRQRRLDGWNPLKVRVRQYFEAVADQWNDANSPLPSISIIDSTVVNPNDKSPQAVNLLFSKQKTGFMTLEDNDTCAVERGCQMVVSQDVYGSVACAIYPAKSELHEHKQAYVIIRLYKDPWQLTDLELDKITRVFFAWHQTTSIYGKARIIDRFRVLNSRMNHLWIHINIWSQASKLASNLLIDYLRPNSQ